MVIQFREENAENARAYQQALYVYITWMMCRKVSSTTKHAVPAFSGFVSATGDAPKKRTMIAYNPMINKSITEYKVVRELLARCVNATRDVGQKYIIITFDLGVVRKAMPII